MAGNLTAMIASIFSGGVTPDPYYEYTTLLLPGNGTNGAQNNTFLDGSTNNFTITRNGNTTQGTFSPFSQTGWGNYFNGSNYLNTPDNAVFTVGSGDFTIEAWVFWQGTGTNTITGQINSAGSSQISYLFRTNATNNLTGGVWSGATSYIATSTGTLTKNQWNHVAFVRVGNTTRLYINGVQDGTANVTGVTVTDSTEGLSIGRPGSYNGDYWTGYISNFRLVKGRCVYPSGTTFNPPTSPLTRTTGGTNPPQGTECSLLTCQSNRFLDSNGVNVPASSPLTITPNGSPAVVAFSPFNPTASWSSATYGGSGYFDGSGDYLSAGSNSTFAFGTGAYTVECWVYPSSVSQQVYVVNDTTNGSVFYFETNNSDGFSIAPRAGAALITGGYSSLIINSWNHVVFVRGSTSANQTSIFVNGSRVANGTDSTNWTVTGPCLIGGLAAGGYMFTGYLSSTRVVKGTAVYDPTQTTLTVPTAPLTAITNTSLLLNFTNAGIYDATSKNGLETVGNAQISTAISAKWGSGSIKFNGTTDYLDIPPSTLIDLGGGDWTFEGWVYPSSLPAGGSTSAIVTLANPIVGGFAALRLRLNSSGTLELYMSTNGSSWAAFGTTSAGISAGQWSYIAVVRSGSGANNVQVYVNGTSRLSLSLSGTPYVGGKYVVGCTFSASAATEFWNGYMQDLRLTKGYARTITASPTAAFPTQ
jgi:hypothetical protein